MIVMKIYKKETDGQDEGEHVTWGLILEGAMGDRKRVGTKLEQSVE